MRYTVRWKKAATIVALLGCLGRHGGASLALEPPHIKRLLAFRVCCAARMTMKCARRRPRIALRACPV